VTEGRAGGDGFFGRNGGDWDLGALGLGKERGWGVGERGERGEVEGEAEGEQEEQEEQEEEAHGGRGQRERVWFCRIVGVRCEWCMRRQSRGTESWRLLVCRIGLVSINDKGLR